MEPLQQNLLVKYIRRVRLPVVKEAAKKLEEKKAVDAGRNGYFPPPFYGQTC